MQENQSGYCIIQDAFSKRRLVVHEMSGHNRSIEGGRDVGIAIV